MSPGLIKMWVTISAMGFMFLSILLIYFSRYKLNNKVLKFTIALFAYVFMIASCLITLVLVLGGPT